jgi:hypothetical protein
MSKGDTDFEPGIEEQGRRYAQERDYDGREPAAIERDIDATRADVRATLAALERRLSFDRLVELTIGRIRERGGEFAGNLTDTATQNPVPVLLTSIGLGWMMLTSRRGSGGEGAARGRGRVARARDKLAGAADEVGDRFHEAQGRFHEAGARLHDAVDASRETLGETAASMRDSASRAAAATREQVEYARERMDRLLHEQPLLLGALGVAAGAIIGALLPATESENRLLGDVRDKAVEKAARASRTGYEAARENAAAYSAPGGHEQRNDGAAGERPSRPH